MRSPYFKKALAGEWAEEVERRVELMVANEQELEELKLLIKLSYTDSYAHDGGELLPFDTRIRLAARADSYEFVGAVNQIIKSLPHNATLEEALTLINDLPLALHQDSYPSLAPVLARAVGRLPKLLGPVCGLFEKSTKLTPHGAFPLRADVKQLSADVMKSMLANKLWQLQVENDLYALLRAWLYQSPRVGSDDERLACFMELAPLLRYQHMTADFLANVVSQCPLMQASGLLPSVMHAALAQREALPSLLVEKKVVRGRPSRGVSFAAASWELEATFTLEKVAMLQPGGGVFKWCGLVAGYPAGIMGKRERAENGQDTLGMFLLIHFSPPEKGVSDAPAAGVGLQTTWTFPTDIHNCLDHFFESDSWGWDNPFGKPWAEAVQEGSPHFPDGKMEVKVTGQAGAEEITRRWSRAEGVGENRVCVCLCI